MPTVKLLINNVRIILQELAPTKPEEELTVICEESPRSICENFCEGGYVWFSPLQGLTHLMSIFELFLALSVLFVVEHF